MLLPALILSVRSKGALKEHSGLGAAVLLVMHRSQIANRPEKGTKMAEEEPILANPPTQEVARHVRDYSHFTRILKWSAIVSVVVAFLVLFIIS